MPEFTLNGRTVQFKEGQTILDVAWENAVSVPVFCYHPHLPVEASCRMCLVKVEQGGWSGVVPACSTPAAEGQAVTTETEGEAGSSRRAVLELLLANHPLECPVCDAGGECDLQEYTMLYGAQTGAYRHEKRRVAIRNAGPLIDLYPNRCIYCSRCTRLIRDVFGEDDWEDFNRGWNTTVGPAHDGPLRTRLSGNLIDVCPLGAILGSDFRFRARPWEETKKRVISPFDSVGSNVWLHVRSPDQMERGPFETSGQRRVLGEALKATYRVNRAVNDPWLGDTDRFGFDCLTGERPAEPTVSGAKVVPDDAVYTLYKLLTKAPQRVGVIAGGAGTNEAALAAVTLFRRLGVKHYDFRAPHASWESAPLLDTSGASASRGTLREIFEADRLLMLGTALEKTHPSAGFFLRKRAIEGKPALVVSPFEHEPRYAIHRYIPGREPDVARSLTALAGSAAPSAFPKTEPSGGFDAAPLEGEIRAWLEAESALVVVPDDSHPDLVSLAAMLANATPGGRLLLLRHRANGQGYTDTGFHPALDRASSARPQPGKGTRAILEAAAAGELDVLLFWDADPASEAETELVEKALKKAKQTASITSLGEGEGSVVIQVAAPWEEAGSRTNTEGRVQWSEPAWPTERPTALQVWSELLARSGEEFPSDPEEAAALLKERVDAYGKCRFPGFVSTDQNTPADAPTLALLSTAYETDLADYPHAPADGRLSDELMAHEGTVAALLPGDIRSHYFLRHSTTLLKLSEEGRVHVNTATMKEQGFADGELVLLETNGGSGEFLVVRDDDLPDNLFGLEADGAELTGGKRAAPVKVTKGATAGAAE